MDSGHCPALASWRMGSPLELYVQVRTEQMGNNYMSVLVLGGCAMTSNS